MLNFEEKRKTINVVNEDKIGVTEEGAWNR